MDADSDPRPGVESENLLVKKSLQVVLMLLLSGFPPDWEVAVHETGRFACWGVVSSRAVFWAIVLGTPTYVINS